MALQKHSSILTEAFLIEEYLNKGKSIVDIAKETELAFSNVRNYLARYQIPLRGTGEARRGYLDCSGFENVTSDWYAYWIGFITADGNVFSDSKKNHVRIQMGLKIEDAGHLKKLQQGLQATEDIKLYPNSGMARINFSHPNFVAALSQWGIVPQKTLTIPWPSNFPTQLIPAYIRGYFDGDGTLMVRRRSTGTTKIVSRFTCGSVQFLDGLEQELHARGIRTIKRYSNSANTHVLPISGSRENLQAFCRLIYQGGTVWLERKKNIFDEAGLSYV